MNTIEKELISSEKMALLLCVFMLAGCVPVGDSSGTINNNGAKINNEEASLINTALNLLKLRTQNQKIP